MLGTDNLIVIIIIIVIIAILGYMLYSGGYLNFILGSSDEDKIKEVQINQLKKDADEVINQVKQETKQLENEINKKKEEDIKKIQNGEQIKPVESFRKYRKRLII